MISVVILTHNDEKILDKTLASLVWCDEVIVVDDASADKIEAVAKKFGAKVYAHGLNDDFASQRNWALFKAKHEWVLFVDSDEVVTPDLAIEIKRVTQASRDVESTIQNSELKNGYYLKRKDWMWGRWLNYGETGRVKLLRLARKDAGLWLRPVHEVWKVQGDIGEFVNPLLHYPHPNVAQFLEEINRYSTLNARYLKSQGIHVSWWQIIVYPKAKFFLNYIWHLGFLDGTAGAVSAILMSFHSFLTRAKLYLLWKKS